MPDKCFFAIVLLVCLFCSPGFAADLTVTAKGKDADTAEINARVNAVRHSMHQLLKPEFISAHSETLRKEIILRSGDFSVSVNVLKSETKEGLIEIEAVVAVDSARLREALAALGAEIPPLSPEELAAERREQNLKYFAMFFNEAVELGPVSTLIAPPEIAPAVSPVNPLYRIENLPERVTSGEKFWIRYSQPLGENNQARHGTIVLCRQDEPPGPLGAVRKQSFSTWNFRSEGDQLIVTAPMAPGNYELRFFDAQRDDAACMARAGFAVHFAENGILPRLRIPRSVFLPGEDFSAEILIDSSPGSIWKDTYIYCIKYEEGHKCRFRLEKPHDRRAISNLLRQLPYPAFKAPQEPGDYALYLYGNDSQHEDAVAVMPFKVRAQAMNDEPLIALNPDHESGWYTGACVSGPPKSALVLERKGVEKPVRFEWVSKNRPFIIAREALEAGEYRLRLYIEEKREQKDLFISEFTVKASEHYAAIRPSMRCEVNRVPPTGAVVVHYTARLDWPQDAWVGIVPLKAPENALEAKKVAKSSFELRNAISGRHELRIQDGPGEYEVRMYAGSKEDSELVALAPLRILNEAELEAEKAGALQSFERYLAAPLPEMEYIGVTDESFRRLFRVPKMRPYLGPVPKGLEEEGGTLLGRGQGNILLAFLDRPEPFCGRCPGSAPVSDAPPYLLAAAAGSDRVKDCSSYLDKEVDLMKRISITLGPENDLKNAAQELAMTMLMKLPIKGDKVALARKVAEHTKDAYSFSMDAMKAWENGNNLDLACTIAGGVSKVILNLCDSPECLDSLREYSQDLLKHAGENFSNEQYKELLDGMTKALGPDNKTVEFLKNVHDDAHTAATAVSDVNFGKAAHEWTAEDYSAMTWTLMSSAVSLHPTGAVVVKAAEASKEAVLAARDLINDDQIQTLYEAYKKGMDGGSGGAEWATAGSLRDTFVLNRARNVMLATLGDKDTRMVLGDKVFRGKHLRSSDISQNEVQKYLNNKFKAWREEEKRAGQVSRYAASLREDFTNLECFESFAASRAAEDARKSYFEGVGDAIKKLWTKDCSFVTDTFKAYMEMRGEIEMELAQWAAGSKSCTRDYLRMEANNLTCTLIQKGEEAYLDSALFVAKECKWKVSDARLMERAYKAKQAEAAEQALAYETAIAENLERIGKGSLLNCLCREAGVAAYGVRAIYHPGPLNDSPACQNSGGACIGGNFGCFRFSMATDVRALQACGAYQAVETWKVEQAAAGLSGQTP
ncbi:hypothetical protein LJC36_02800 [Desulfovibrio sp. OttesenSCG-928-C14]|nr:hypothetical protein [Desulfovibrio sp. OttesenSCG-928-C14]